LSFGEAIDFVPGVLGSAFQFKSHVNEALNGLHQLADNNSNRVAITFVDVLQTGGDAVAPYAPTLAHPGWPLTLDVGSALSFYYREWGPIVGYEWIRSDPLNGDILVWEVTYNPALLHSQPAEGS
jgi:hypothetical protein